MVTKEGICALCGHAGRLTFEHIPPRAAFNDRHVKSVRGDVYFKASSTERLLWNLDGLRYESNQRGSGGYYLCERCNSVLGGECVEQYVQFAEATAYYLHETGAQTGQSIELDIKSFCPGGFIRELMSMFCCVNRGWESELFSDMRSYVLDLERDRPPLGDWRLYAYILRDGLEKQLGLSGMMFKDGIKWVSEITAWPLGFVLSVEGSLRKEPGVDLSCLASYSWESEQRVTVALPIKETWIPLPLDYRTKEEIGSRRISVSSSSNEDNVLEGYTYKS